MPGGTVCSVAACKNNSKKSRENSENISFFTFPKDPNMQKVWVRKCYRKDRWSCANKRICSIHFKPDDYEDELQARLMNLKPKVLKKDAIPSLFLFENEEKLASTARSKRMIRKEQKMFVEDLICSDSKEKCPKSNESLDDNCQQQSSSKEIYSDVWKRKFEACEKENSILKQKLEDHENHEKMLQARISHLEQHVKNYDITYEENMKYALKDFLTSNQIDIALEKKSKVHWTQEELSRAFTLRYFSKL